MEADLQRFYGIHISQLGTPTLSWRRLGVLIRQLPVDSATAFAQAGAAGQVGITERLLVEIEYRLGSANWQRSGGKGQRPKRLRLPGDDPDPLEQTIGTAVPIDEMRDILDNWGVGAVEQRGHEEVL